MICLAEITQFVHKTISKAFRRIIPERFFFFHRLFRGKVLYNSKIILKFVAKKEKAFTI